MKHVAIWLAEGLPSSVKAKLPTHQQKFFKGLQDPYNSRGISIPSREQDQRDTDKRQALKRGGI